MNAINISQLVNINFDLLSVGVAVAGIALLGFLIYRSNPKSITNRTFLLFAGISIVWGISNYLEYRFTTVETAVWALRVHLFISTLYAFVFFRLAYVFPEERIVFPRWYKFALVPIVATTMILVLTPLVFSGIEVLAPEGQVTRGTPGPGIPIFIIVAFGLLISSLVLLFRRERRSVGMERRQMRTLFAGMLLMAILILTFNVVLPNIFSNLSFIPLAALFILPFIALTSYAIYKHQLFNFNLKVATAGVLGFMVTVFSFVNVLYSTDLSEVVINVTAFLIVLLGSIKIVEDMLNLGKLTEELAKTNERQEGLIHFLSHEVKGFLTKDINAFAALAEGDFGILPDGLKPFVERALSEARGGARSVMDILQASNQKKGTMTYQKEAFDFKALAEDVVAKTQSMAEKRGITLSFSADESGAPYTLSGDKGQIGDHMLRNLVENAVNYTPSGSVAVSLKKANGKLIFTVKDTGVGISNEDKARLFTEGGRGKDSIKVNVHSTGYGLYIAKNIVTAHGGTIRAESAGPGTGSTFVVELPV